MINFIPKISKLQPNEKRGMHSRSPIFCVQIFRRYDKKNIPGENIKKVNKQSI